MKYGEGFMADHASSAAHKVHHLLLEAHPQGNNENLVKAAHIAEAEGRPPDDLQQETFVAIRNLRTAIEGGASAADAESLLLHAIEVAEHWVRKADNSRK